MSIKLILRCNERVDRQNKTEFYQGCIDKVQFGEEKDTVRREIILKMTINIAAL